MISDVVALYVDRNGPYPEQFAEWYDDRRDARTYAGDLPVIAHPPCQRWCRLAGLVEARWGHKRGEDGGLFAHALATVRRCGGVLEHPAYSDAWAAYGLPRPVTGEGWSQGAEDDEWTCYVEQWRYGHRAKKATWLYYCGRRAPFELRFGELRFSGEELALVGYANNHRTGHRSNRTPPPKRARLTKKQGHETPPMFMSELLKLARWAVAP